MKFSLAVGLTLLTLSSTQAAPVQCILSFDQLPSEQEQLVYKKRGYTISLRAESEKNDTSSSETKTTLPVSISVQFPDKTTQVIARRPTSELLESRCFELLIITFVGPRQSSNGIPIPMPEWLSPLGCEEIGFFWNDDTKKCEAVPPTASNRVGSKELEGSTSGKSTPANHTPPSRAGQL